MAEIDQKVTFTTNSPTFAKVVSADTGPSAGFDYLRLGLSVAITIEHVFKISIPWYDEAMPASWFGPVNRAELGMFFALSGFLVAGSLLRNNVPRFLALRILRIIPALAVEVVLTALIIGVCFTTLPLPEYFRSPLFWSYFLNIVGDIHFTLPGVFDNAQINLQLWTVPIEFECYLTLVAFSLLRLVRGKNLLLIIVSSASVSLTIFALQNNAVQVGPVMPGWALVSSFLYGVLGFLFQPRLPRDKYLALASMAAAYGLLALPNLVFLAPIPIAYFTICIGLLRLPKMPFGDRSYGIYLFHNPVLRTIFELGGGAMPIALLIALTLIVTWLFASLSWAWVEKPIMQRKDRLLIPVDGVCAMIAMRPGLLTVRTKAAGSRAPFPSWRAKRSHQD